MVVPEDIILGPPKTAFASASGARNATRNIDSPHRPSFNNHDGVPAKHDRNNFRDRQSRDGQRDAEQTRDSRVGPDQTCQGTKVENDLWSNVRQRRPSGSDDAERLYSRNGDRGNNRDGQGERDNRQVRGFENHRRERDRETDTEHGARRTVLGRGRNQPSWYRNEARAEDGLEVQEPAKSRENRNKERQGARGPDKEWTRGSKVELDPEWMEAPEAEDANRVHTQEDFERWKERMKSNNAIKPDTTVEQQTSHNRSASGAGSGTAKVKVDTPLVVDSSVDGFFGLWNQPKKKQTVNGSVNGSQPTATSTGATASKPSKFTGFFNHIPDPEPQKEKLSLPVLPPASNSSNEDREGFQRILSLLGQHQQPQDGKSETLLRSQRQRDVTGSPPLQPPAGVENNDLYNLLESRSSPTNPALQGRDSEFLLKLKQQPHQHGPEGNQANLIDSRPSKDTNPGQLPLSNLMISPHDTSQHTPSSQPPLGSFDDLPARDKLNPGAERRAPPPGLFDTNIPRQTLAGMPQQTGFPLGLQRPPGLDSFPPGYTQHVQHQRQNIVPPPGFQAPPRGQNAFPPGLIPNDRLQFGVPTNGRGLPPPGFMHPVPSGFPVPFGQEGVPYGNLGDGGQFGHGFPPSQQRR